MSIEGEIPGAMRVEFHQAEINVVVLITDGDKSHGLRQMQTVALLNTEAEWLNVMAQIETGLQQIREEVAHGSGD